MKRNKPAKLARSGRRRSKKRTSTWVTDLHVQNKVVTEQMFDSKQRENKLNLLNEVNS